MRLLLALAALTLLATFAPFSLFREPAPASRPLLYFEPVPLNEQRPAQTRLGQLVYLGGWALTSNDPRYGALSAIHVANGELLGLSDGSVLFRHSLPGDRQGLPIAVHRLEAIEDKRQRDTEAMVVGREDLWVTFERRNEVRRYDRATLRRQAVARPAAMRQWYKNSGAEAMARLPGNRFLVISERSRRGPGLSQALLFFGDPSDPKTRARSLWMRSPEGYRPTEVAHLPDERLLLLVRRFSLVEGFTAKLLIVDQRELREGATLTPREIASFEPPITRDNLEGLSVTIENGRAIIWIASDDNHIALQRTLLMKFRLAE